MVSLKGMSRLHRRAALCMLFAACITAGTGTSPAGAIEGGWPVANGDLPYVGRILIPYSSTTSELCTVILIRPDVGITAKHCFKDHGYNPAFGAIAMRFGSTSSTEGGQVRTAVDLRLGSNFDLALVHFQSTTAIATLPLARSDQKGLWKNGTVTLASGWGSNSPTLQAANMKIKDQVYSSAQALSGYNYLMKAESYRGNVTPGDSGGPLINEQSINGQVVETLVGVLSQKSRGGAAAYTKVGSTLPWITSNLNSIPVLAPPA
ncbi:V8-like Glu-specific endopeptidase [Streptomyces sp. SLBN-8D4]